MISVAAYLHYRQSAVYQELAEEYQLRPLEFYERARKALLAVDAARYQRVNWRRLMEERPLPGRAGLLEGESDPE